MKWLVVCLLFLTACSRNGSLIPKNPNEVVNLPQINLVLSTNEDVSLATNLFHEYSISSPYLSAKVINNVSFGVLTLSPEGQLSFVPPLDYSGDQTFEVEFSYKNKVIGTKIVDLKTINVDDTPLATSTAFTVLEDGVYNGNLTGSDVDSTFTYAIETQGSKGTVIITDPVTGAFEYEPYPDAFGADVFTFKTYDGNSYSSLATVNVSITPVNDAPVASSMTINVVESTTYNFDLLGTDVDGDSLTYTIDSNVSHGTLSCVAKACSYTSNANETLDSFTYHVSDSALSSSSVTVNINISSVNDAPVSSNFSFSTNEDTVYNGSISATDADGPSLSWVLITNGSKGNVVLNSATGAFSYTPNLNANGSDSFTFKVSDSLLDSSVYTASITINSVNDVPQASNLSVTLLQNEIKSITLVGSDVESSVTYSIVANATHGSVSCVNEVCQYAPTYMYVGSDSFTYKVNDGTADSSVATVNLTIQDNGNWFNPQWGYRKKIAVNNSHQSLTSGTWIVKLSSDNVDYTKIKNDGSDLRFVTEAGGVLPHSLVHWEQNSNSYVLVRSNLTANGSDDYVWMYYGNASATTVASSSAVWATEIVSSYHFEEPSGNLVDDKGLNPATTTAVRGPGFIGQGVSLNSGVSNQSVLINASSSLNLTSSFSLEVVVKEQTRHAVSSVVSKKNPTFDPEFSLRLENGVPVFQVRNQTVTASTAITLNESTHLMAVYNTVANTCEIFVNSKLVATGSCSTDPVGANTNVILGNDYLLGEGFSGLIDEVKVYNQAQSSDKVKFQHQSIRQALAMVGTENIQGQTPLKHMFLSIVNDNDDGFVDASLHTQGSANKNHMGYDTDYVWAYYRFQTSKSIPASAYITQARMRLFGKGTNSWDSSNHYLAIVGEQVSNASVVSSPTQYPDGATGETATVNQTLWGYPGLSWMNEYNTSPNIANIFQEIVNDFSPMPVSNHIQLWVRGAYNLGGATVMTSDYSDQESIPAQIFVEWEE